MCWKRRYSCGHVTDTRCRAPIKNPNDPEDDDLGYYCRGLPKDYTDHPVPCQNCLIKEAPARDENKGDNKGGANDDAGRGNTSRMGYMLANGCINVTHIGSWPWDKSWMPGMVGMKYNEDGYIVDDPDSTVRYYTFYMRQDTHQFDWDAEYDNLTHDLEALSSNPAYANMEYEVEFRQPMDAARQSYIRRGGPAYGRIPTPVTSPVRSNIATPSLSPASSGPASPASIFSATDLEPDTPATQLSFNSIDAFGFLTVPGAIDIFAIPTVLVSEEICLDAADAREDFGVPV